MSRVLLVLGAALCFCFPAAALFSQTPRPFQRPMERKPAALLEPAEAYPSLGNSNAPVWIVEFSEFGCSYCRRHAKTVLPSILEKYVDAGQARYVFVQVPPVGEQGSQIGAIALLCAARSDALLAMYRKLFELDELNRSTAEEAAAAAGIQSEKFSSCTSSAQVRADLQRHTELAKRSGVVGTPTFLIGRVKDQRLVEATKIFGLQSESYFDSTIARLLTAQGD